MCVFNSSKQTSRPIILKLVSLFILLCNLKKMVMITKIYIKYRQVTMKHKRNVCYEQGEGHPKTESTKNNTNSGTSQPRPASHSKKEPPNIPNGNTSDSSTLVFLKRYIADKLTNLVLAFRWTVSSLCYMLIGDTTHRLSLTHTHTTVTTHHPSITITLFTNHPSHKTSQKSHSADWRGSRLPLGPPYIP